MQFILVEGLDNGTIVERTSEKSFHMVLDALKVRTIEIFHARHERAVEDTSVLDADTWLQLFVRAIGVRRDSIGEFGFERYSINNDTRVDRKAFTRVHSNTKKETKRCFHVELNDTEKYTAKARLNMRFTARLGRQLVGYNIAMDDIGRNELKRPHPEVWETYIDVSHVLEKGSIFFLWITMLLEKRLNREQQPFGSKANKLCRSL